MRFWMPIVFALSLSAANLLVVAPVSAQANQSGASRTAQRTTTELRRITVYNRPPSEIRQEIEALRANAPANSQTARSLSGLSDFIAADQQQSLILGGTPEAVRFAVILIQGLDKSPQFSDSRYQVRFDIDLVRYRATADPSKPNREVVSHLTGASTVGQPFDAMTTVDGYRFYVRLLPTSVEKGKTVSLIARLGDSPEVIDTVLSREKAMPRKVDSAEKIIAGFRNGNDVSQGATLEIADVLRNIPPTGSVYLLEVTPTIFKFQ
ncbi:MAG: hypothetical protein OHK0029_20750 [Armatimonadaceae bacterium]